ncbi:hypothetical protein HC931_03945 [Candidatus Gracilibacteria bacterium]|nr:hypothetical protein [Candidatus Gracilibacteria bacterium]NJM87178.1 hypothetical protein [Hydrococcus sp. RU_2_2]NJP20315.1 hypothetical protein [Hydrococcus sp. CRU_1_1]
MTIAKETQSIQYDSSALKRAERALRCSPFKLGLLVAMQNQSVPLNAIASTNGVQQGYTQKTLTESRTESNLMWLIDVGLLRREVDGQGITDSFRLTPLGRQLVEKWSEQGSLGKPLWLDRLINTINRWFHLPF